MEETLRKGTFPLAGNVVHNRREEIFLHGNILQFTTEGRKHNMQDDFPLHGKT
jgi:hypothetical protein